MDAMRNDGIQVVASVIAWAAWRRVGRHDVLLMRPWRWFAANLRPLPIVAPTFVVLVFALRHAIHWAIGVPYEHEPWLAVFLYETPKFALFYVLGVAVAFGVRLHGALGAQRL